MLAPGGGSSQQRAEDAAEELIDLSCPQQGHPTSVCVCVLEFLDIPLLGRLSLFIFPEEVGLKMLGCGTVRG